MLPNVKPALDPLAHRAAIQALEAQRAAYRRFSVTVAGHQHALGTGDGEQATRAADVVQLGYQELDAGALQLAPLVSAVHAGGSGEQLDELQRHMTDLAREAQQAEAAIQNLTAQLTAWRDAYGRQLAEQGITPGGQGGGRDEVAADPAGAAGGARGAQTTHGGYGPRGARAETRGLPSLLDRKG